MKNNPQFIRTDKAIRQAFITLLKTKPFEKITVQNILDETPVTRSTFYKHFRDKYEIAEKLQAEFFESLRVLRLELRKNPQANPATIKLSQESQELMHVLLKIHTEQVDIRSTLTEYSKEHYLSGITGNFPEIEAEVFANSITAFQLSSYLTELNTIENMHDIFISVMLRILGIPDDEELQQLLKEKAILIPAPQQITDV